MIWKLSETIIKNYHSLNLDSEVLKNIWETLFSTIKDAVNDF